MRILMAHTHYRQRGGEDESFLAEAALLESAGHEVTRYVLHNDALASMRSAEAALTTVWNRSAFRDVTRLLSDGGIQVAHFQNTFPLMSPSVYYAARNAGVPIVQTLRNYRLTCVNALLFREGGPCESCVGSYAPWNGAVHGCYRDSRAASAVVAGMLAFHKARGAFNDMVHTYVTLTDFAKRTLVRAGLQASKTVVKPNFLGTDPGAGPGRGGYALFVGRLSQEKGVATMLDAWGRLHRRIPLKVVGDGPLAATVAARSDIDLEWLGRRAPAEVLDLMGDAELLVFPSECYETFGRVAVEAFAKGTPVIASDIGAVAEIVDHGRTGLRFRPGDVAHLVETVESALSDPARLQAMRREARLEFEAKYTAERNLQQLEAIYERAIT